MTETYKLNWHSEAKRALNFYSLTLALVVAITGATLCHYSGWLAVEFGIGNERLFTVLLALGLFVALSVPHLAMHCYFGWRLGKGISAFHQGDYPRAKSLLRCLDYQPIKHYDPHGLAEHCWLQLCSGREDGQRQP